MTAPMLGASALTAAYLHDAPRALGTQALLVEMFPRPVRVSGLPPGAVATETV